MVTKDTAAVRKNVARMLRNYRIMRNCAQRDIAEGAGIEVSRYKKIECGDTKYTDVELALLAKHCGTTVALLRGPVAFAKDDLPFCEQRSG